MPVPMVDTHVHVVIRNDPAYPMKDEIELDWVNTHSVTVEQLIERMDEAGVSKAALVQAYHGHGFDNSYTADSAARFPERFAAVGTLDPVAPGAADELRRWVVEKNVRGFRIRPDGWKINDPRTFASWEAARELGVVMDIWRVGPPAFDDYREMLERFPDVVIAHDHAAHVKVDDGPPFKQAQPLFELARYPNLNIKFSTNVLMNCLSGGYDPGDFLERLVDAYGADRILWSSNYPALHEPEWPLTRMTQVARDAVSRFSAEQQAAMLGGTAMRLWPELAG